MLKTGGARPRGHRAVAPAIDRGVAACGRRVAVAGDAEGDAGDADALMRVGELKVCRGCGRAFTLNRATQGRAVAAGGRVRSCGGR
jgi:hypothetical protein